MDDSDNCGGCGDVYNGRAEPILGSLLDSYSEDNAILVDNSKYSSYSAYTVY